MKQHKNMVLLFLSLITCICIVYGVRVTGKDELIRNTRVLNARAIERIAGETVAASTELVAVTSTRKAVWMDRKLQELSASINQCAVAQHRENNKFWAYLMHLDNHLHQLAVYMKDHHRDFLESLLQQFNFGTPAAESEEIVAKLDSAAEPKEEDQPTQEVAESLVPAAHSSTEQEDERDSGDDPIEQSQIPPTRGRRKHTIGDDDEDETEEDPPIPVLSIKGKEKILHDEDSEEWFEYIDTQLEAAAERVTRTPAARKNLLDNIAEITAEDATTAKSTRAAPLQLPAKSPSATNKRRGATSGGTTEPVKLVPKCTRFTQATHSTSPPPRQKK